MGTAGSDRREGLRSECGWCPAADQAVACAVVCAQRDAAAQDCAGVREVRRCTASSGRCSDCATQSLLGPVRPLSSDTPTRGGQYPTQSRAIAQPAPLRPFRTRTTTTAVLTACSPRAHRMRRYTTVTARALHGAAMPTSAVPAPLAVRQRGVRERCASTAAPDRRYCAAQCERTAWHVLSPALAGHRLLFCFPAGRLEAAPRRVRVVRVRRASNRPLDLRRARAPQPPPHRQRMLRAESA
jgi:hypothetical protein